MPVAESPRARRNGFTLVEVIVALMISAITIAGARAVTAVLVDQAARLDAVHTEAAEFANGERLLRQLVLETEAGRDPRSRFTGAPASAEFDSWCRVPQGWSERCHVSLSLAAVDADSLNVLRARLSTGEQLTLGRFVAPTSLRYLEDAAHGGTWSRTWGPGTAAPLAIGVIAGDDMLILPTRREP